MAEQIALFLQFNFRLMAVAHNLRLVGRAKSVGGCGM